MPETLYLSNPHSDDRFKIVQNFGPLCGDSVRSCVSTASTATKVIQMAVHAMSRHKESNWPVSTNEKYTLNSDGSVAERLSNFFGYDLEDGESVVFGEKDCKICKENSQK